MKKQKSMGNKGFSLVELIIVIAIMAILVGVLAPQLLKYVERSRQAKDIQAVDTVHTAIVTAMLDPAVDDAPASKNYTDLASLYGDTTSPKFVAAVKEIVNNDTASNIEGDAFTSKAYKKSKIEIDINSNKVTCTVAAQTGSGADDIVIN
jgi:type IV pilus assembly protein PilA